MMKDNKLLICSDLAITATAVLTNTITLSKSDIGSGRPLFLHVHVTTAFSGGTGAFLRVALGTTSGGILVFCANTGPIAAGLLIANEHFSAPLMSWPQANLATAPIQVPLDVDTLSLTALATVMTATGTEDGTFAAGKITVDITADPAITSRLFPTGTGSYTGG